MALTELKCKTAKPAEKDYPLPDEKGLRLLIRKTGSKTWQLRYRRPIDQKADIYTIGSYPEISLSYARTERDKARSLIAKGVDPKAQEKAAKATQDASNKNTFKLLALEWHAKQIKTWAPATAVKRLALINNDLLPSLGTFSIDAITSVQLLELLNRIDGRGANEVAHRARQVLGQIFKYARVTQRTKNNPVDDLRGALPKTPTKHFPAITEPKKFGKLLLDIENYHGGYVIRSLLALCPLLFQRIGEMVTMKWSDLDFENGEWRYLVTKTDTLHIVPLCKQSIQILTELKQLTGYGQYVFPSERRNDGFASIASTNKALRAMGYDTKTEHTTHGFRGSARTIMDEVLGFRIEMIEQQLAHAVRDALGRAYNRTTYLPQRKEMMQKWADYLERLRELAASSKVITVSFGKQINQ
ncbi:MAG TPA: integrase arm-type DNA-binding domain-containing protein [Cellvibrio sp.]|nr:integrase arm-type DNA-binding domain-containing protein [Cellvibrio sp.]